MKKGHPDVTRVKFTEVKAQPTTMISRTHILASAVVLLFSVASTCLLANRFSLRNSPPR